MSLATQLNISTTYPGINGEAITQSTGYHSLAVDFGYEKIGEELPEIPEK